MQNFVNAIAAGQTELKQLLKSEHHTTRHHMTTETSRVENSVKVHVTETITHGMRQFSIVVATNAQRERLLGSLKYPAMNERRNAIEERPVVEFDTMFQANDEETAWDSFQAWLESDNDFYWISGKPGSGKSTLVSYW